MNMTPEGGASFEAGTGEQHVGPVRKVNRKKLKEIIEQRVMEILREKQLLNEQSYTAYRQQVTKATPRQQVSRSLSAIRGKLKETKQLLAHMGRLQETLAESDTVSPAHDKIKEEILGQLKEIYRALYSPKK